MPTLSQLLKINHQTLIQQTGLSNVFDDAPVIGQLPSQPSSHGILHQFDIEKTGPVVGFRDVNNGAHNTNSEEERVIIQLKILDASWRKDQAAIDSYYSMNPDGTIARDRTAAVLRETARHIRAALALTERQIFMGGQAKGFDGLNSYIKTNEQVVNAGGTVSGTIGWAIYAPSDLYGMGIICGSDANLEATDVQEGQEKTTDGGFMPVLFQNISGYLSLQMTTKYCAVKIANITEATPLDDNLLAKAFTRFPTGRKPTAFVFNSTALELLRASRTATNPTGAPAPFPTDFNNIPLLITDNIDNNISVWSPFT